MQKVVIKFDNPAAAKHFMLWLCNQGEQGYWDHMTFQDPEDGQENITAHNIKYDFKKFVIDAKP